MKTTTKLWIGIGVLILLAPLGLLLPEAFKAGSAWGEWGADEIKNMIGSVPAGLEKLEGIWKAILPDYSIPGWESAWKSRIAYIFSGIVGVGVTVGLTFLLGKFLSSKEEAKNDSKMA